MKRKGCLFFFFLGKQMEEKKKSDKKNVCTYKHKAAVVSCFLCGVGLC